jgi:hypothetical protein
MPNLYIWHIYIQGVFLKILDFVLYGVWVVPACRRPRLKPKHLLDIENDAFERGTTGYDLEPILRKKSEKV